MSEWGGSSRGRDCSLSLAADFSRGRAHGHELLRGGGVDPNHAVYLLFGQTPFDGHGKALRHPEKPALSQGNG